LYKTHLIGYIKYTSSDAWFHECLKKNGREWSASCPGHFTNGEETPLVPTEQDAG